jgi:hypothetical protein
LFLILKVILKRTDWRKALIALYSRKVTDKLVYLFVWWCLTPLSTIFQFYHILLCTSSWLRIELTTSVVIEGYQSFSPVCPLSSDFWYTLYQYYGLLLGTWS